MLLGELPFPWVGKFPLVAPTSEEGRYRVGRSPSPELCSLARTVALIEAALSASPVQPFFGSADDLESVMLS